MSSIVLGLTMYFHTYVGSAVAVGLVVYSVIYGWFRSNSFLGIKGMLLGLVCSVLVNAVFALLFAFWLLPIAKYSSVANEHGAQVEARDQIVRWAQVQEGKRLLFDWGPIEPTDVFPIPPVPRLLTLLSIMGSAIALVWALVATKLFKKRDSISVTAVSLAGVGVFFLVWTGLASYISPLLVDKLRMIFSYLHYRVLAVSFVMIPIMAGFAIFAVYNFIADLILLPLSYKKINKIFIFRFIKGIVVSYLVICTFVFLLLKYEKGNESTDFIGYGPMEDPVIDEKHELGYKGFYFKDDKKDYKFSLDIFNPYKVYENIKNSYAHSVISSKEVFPKETSDIKFGLENYIKPVVESMELNQFTRVGLSGAVGALLQEWNSYTDSSTLNQFNYRGSMFQSLRGFAETVFFGKDPANHDPVLLNNLAKYIGYRYVVLSNAEDINHYTEDNWISLGEKGGWLIFEQKDNQGIVTVTKRPLVLVIGRKAGAFESVFRSATYGMIPYDSAWLVEGGERVDKYNLEELKKFDAIILYGYNYKNRLKAFSNLDKYAKEGGRLFIETGWQFVSKDWQTESAPDFFPVDKLVWNAELGSISGSEVDLTWEGGSWGVSTSTSLKSWAKPILTVDGKHIISGGSYGKGQVVLSGLNLFGLTGYKKYDPKLIELGKNIFNDLIPQYKDENLPLLGLVRDFPDDVTINIKGSIDENTKLMWREGYTPNWVVTLNGKKLKTYRAGIGFVSVILPKTTGDSVLKLHFSLGSVGIISKLISILTVLLFVVLILDSLLYKNKYSQMLIDKLKKPFSGVKVNINKSVKSWKDEDY